jgi:hypothetical protein
MDVLRQQEVVQQEVLVPASVLWQITPPLGLVILAEVSEQYPVSLPAQGSSCRLDFGLSEEMYHWCSSYLRWVFPDPLNLFCQELVYRLWGTEPEVDVKTRSSRLRRRWDMEEAMRSCLHLEAEGMNACCWRVLDS